MIDDLFLCEIWCAAKEETERVRDAAMNNEEKLFVASQRVAERIFKHAQFLRVSGLNEVRYLPESEQPMFFIIGLAIGNMAAWHGHKFFETEERQ